MFLHWKQVVSALETIVKIPFGHQKAGKISPFRSYKRKREKMKKKGLLYAAAAACCIAIPMHAENFSGTIIKDSIKTRHELKIGLGFGAHQLDNSRNAMTNVFLQKYHLEGAVECGNIYGNSYLCNNLEYHYRLNNHLEIGGFVATGLSDENYENPHIAYDDPSPIAAVAYEHCNYIAFAPSLRYIW